MRRMYSILLVISEMVPQAEKPIEYTLALPQSWLRRYGGQKDLNRGRDHRCPASKNDTMKRWTPAPRLSNRLPRSPFTHKNQLWHLKFLLYALATSVALRWEKLSSRMSLRGAISISLLIVLARLGTTSKKSLMTGSVPKVPSSLATHYSHGNFITAQLPHVRRCVLLQFLSCDLP